MKRMYPQTRARAVAIARDYRYPAIFLAGASVLVVAFSLLLRGLL